MPEQAEQSRNDWLALISRLENMDVDTAKGDRPVQVWHGVDCPSLIMVHPEFVIAPDYQPVLMIRIAEVLFGYFIVYVVSANFIKDFASAGTQFKFVLHNVILVGNDDNGGSPMVNGDAIPPVPSLLIVQYVDKGLMRRGSLFSQTLVNRIALELNTPAA